MALRIVGDHARAEDIIHDAFLQILRDAKDFDPARGSARGWVYAIVQHTALKNKKRASREVPEKDDELLARCDDGQNQSEGWGDLASSIALRTSLEQMEPRRRASLLLAIIDGRTHQEIAGLLHVPVGTVKAWIRRELIALRKRLTTE